MQWQGYPCKNELTELLEGIGSGQDIGPLDYLHVCRAVCLKYRPYDCRLDAANLPVSLNQPQYLSMESYKNEITTNYYLKAISRGCGCSKTKMTKEHNDINATFMAVYGYKGEISDSRHAAWLGVECTF